MTKKSILLDIDSSIMEENMRIIKNNAREEEELCKLFANTDNYPYKIIQPTPGFCVKTFTKNNKKLFINVGQTDAIPCPNDITNEELIQILSSENPSSYRVPMSIGEGRLEKDKCGIPATVYDIAININFFSKIEKDEVFQTFFLTVVFEGLQDKYQFEIDMSKYTILKNRKSIGNLQTHRIQIRHVITSDETEKPLIEEIKKRAKESIKEIFFRLKREPPTGEIQYLLAEFKIPCSVELQDLNLEVGEDRILLDFNGLFEPVDFFLPCNVDQEIVNAELNRNIDTLTVTMPVIH